MYVYFSHLISYRCAIDSVMYAVDSDTPDTQFETGPCDPDNPHAVPESGPGSKIHIIVPKATGYVTVQLSYADGTRSEVKRFDAP